MRRFRLQPQAQMAAGEIVNVTSLHLSAHTGTHVDAFHHYVDGATVMDRMDLALYWGPAQVVTVDKPAGPLYPADFAAVDLARAPRLLLRSSASHADPTRFFRDYVYPDPALAAELGRQGIRLFGTDAPSVDPPDSKTANWLGDIFGGWLMSHADIAGSIHAYRRAGGKVVTVSVDDFTFLQPVFVGDVVTFFCELRHVGRTSMSVAVDIQVERPGSEAGTFIPGSNGGNHLRPYR